MKKRSKIFILIFFPLIAMIGITILSLSLGSDKGRVKVDRTISLPKSFHFGDEKIALVYFGYIGCHYVCLPAMNEVKNLLNDLKINESRNNIRAYFISLQPEIDQDSVNAYAKSFHPAMVGKRVDTKILNALQSKFKFTWGKSPFDASELNHTGFLYLLLKENQQWILKSIYITRPFNIKTLTKEIKSYL